MPVYGFQKPEPPRPDSYPTLNVAKAKFEAVLDRVEAAQRNENAYGMVENAGDIAVVEVFVADWWDHLTHAEQTKYRSRLAYIRALGRGLR